MGPRSNFTCVFKASQNYFSRLGQFGKALKTCVKLNTNFTRPHAITYIHNNDVRRGCRQTLINISTLTTFFCQLMGGYKL